MASTYWDRWWTNRASRRRILAAGGTGMAGLSALALVGCGDDDDGGNGGGGGGGGTTPTAAPSVDKPVAGGTYRYFANIGSVLDPHRTNTPTESIDVWGRIGNFLMRFTIDDPIGLPEPDLAAAMPEIPGDGTLLTFKLRPEAKWHNRAPVNGRAVTAEDIKLSFERIKDPATVSPRAGSFANVDTMTVVDPTTIQFKLKAPQADLLNLMADQYNLMIPKEIAVRGKDAIQGPQDCIGSGPYELTEFVAAQKLTLRRRADGQWRKDIAWIDSFELIHQTDSQRAADALRAGQVDVAGLPIDLVKGFENNKDYYIITAKNPTRECLLVNHNADPVKDPKVRAALWRAVNRKQVYDTVFGGAGIAGGPMTPAAEAWVLSDAELAKMQGFGKREDELKEAKALLSAAGFPNGLEITVLTVTAFDTDKVHDVLVSNLAEAGIKVKTENVGTDFAANFLPREVKREYTLATTLFLSGPYPDAQLLLYHHSDVKTKGTRNYGDYTNTALDAKLEKQATIYDSKQRLPLVQEIQRDIINNPGPIWLGSRIGLAVVSQRVKNGRGFPFASGHHTAEKVWLKS